MTADAIRQADSLTAAEKQQLFSWGKDVFGVETLNLSWRPKNLHFLLDSGREPVSHVGVLRQAIAVNGQSVTVGGVGGVVTVPAAQKQGHARRLLQHATNKSRNL